VVIAAVPGRWHQRPVDPSMPTLGADAFIVRPAPA
jgi:hypothetical protein